MLRAGIVGLPNVGKSTLFNALVQNHQAEAENFPFCTIEPNIGTVNVPDERLESLNRMYNSQKIVPAAIEFVDIAGLVKGASEGAGLGNKFLSHIREVDLIVQVLRCFEDENVHHVDGSIDPVRDLENICLELAMADIQTITKRMDKLAKGIKAGDKVSKQEADLLERIYKDLERMESNDFSYVDEQANELIGHLNLLSLKPLILAANLDESELQAPERNRNYCTLTEKAEYLGIKVVPISANIEAELTNLDSEEAEEYLQALGVEQSGVNSLISATFARLGLICFLTAGETEIRAWPIPNGSKAIHAAGRIHSDIERGFIKAEVVSYRDLMSYGSKIKAREAGKVRLEGKEYLMQDGDVVEFKFNV